MPSGPQHFFKGYAFAPATLQSDGFPQEAIALIEEAAAVRGWCVQSFAQVEFMLAALVEAAASKWPDVYGHLAVKMPFAPGKRPARVRDLLAIDGPLAKHAPQLHEVMEDLSDFEDFRHMLVHGWSDVLNTPKGLMLRWRRYQPTTEEPWKQVIVATTIETLRMQGENSKAFANAAVGYLRALFLHYRLEE